MMLRLSTMKSVKTLLQSDMFRIASEDSMFNIMNIQDQMDYTQTGIWQWEVGLYDREFRGRMMVQMT